MNDERTEYKRLDSSFVEKRMLTGCFGKKVLYYEEVDSTNTVAKQLGRYPGNHGVLVLAERQNAGRGRLGRNWSSPGGSGIWMSLVLQSGILPANASMLTLVTALAVNRGIREETGLESFIKWPNDIIINGKKVCGILTEMSTVSDKLECVVIGMGINVNGEYFSEELKSRATSLRMECRKEVDRVNLIVNIMKYMEYYYEVFERTETLKYMVDEYNKFLINRNLQVRIREADSEYTGLALGINETGALLVETEEINQGLKNTSVKTVMSGEVSVRGILGYV